MARRAAAPGRAVCEEARLQAADRALDGGRGEALARLVAAAPGIAAFATPEAVGRVFARGEAQARWSLLFYALWHAHHVLGVDATGGVEEVLAAAGRRG